MSDFAGLALVVVALYLSECVVWARHGASVVTAPLVYAGMRLRVLTRLGTARGAFVLLNPLPPFGRVYVVEPLPFTMSPTSVVAAQRFALANEPPAIETGRALSWSEVTNARVVDRDVHVAGALFARCSSARHARAAVDVLARVAAAGEAGRAAAIEAALAAHFDVEEARRRARAHARWSAPLIAGATLVFAALFVFVPRVVLATGSRHWPLLVASVYLGVVVCAVALFVAHARLAPRTPEGRAGERGERWLQTLLLLPAPTMAMRANDKLGRYLLAGLHPVAVALALLRGAARDDVVGRALRELAHPRGGRARDASDDALLARVRALATQEGVDVDAAFAAPPLRAGQVAWCPRCRLVYRAPGACADCAVALVDGT